MKAATRYLALCFVVPALAYCTSSRGGSGGGGTPIDEGTGGSGGTQGRAGSSSEADAGASAGENSQGGEAGSAGADPEDSRAEPPVVPPIPTPSSLGEVPESEVMTRIEPWHTFRPPLNRARCDWSVSTQRCFYPPAAPTVCLDFSPVPESSGEYFSDEIPNDDLDAPLALSNPWGYQMMLVEDGERIAPVGSEQIDEVLTEEEDGIDIVLNAIYAYDCPAPQSEPYMRWDRFWRIVELDSDGPFLLIDGEVEGSMTATYTTGVSISETTTFIHSTTTSVSVSFESLGAEFSESFTEVYSNTVTISQEMSHEFSQTVQGVAGATRQFMIWQLVDRLSVTDSEGEPLLDPNYEFPPILLEIPSAKALKVTDFLY